MKGYGVVAVLSCVVAALACVPQDQSKEKPQTKKKAPAVVVAEPLPLTDKQFDDLQAALKKLALAEKELMELQERLKETKPETVYVGPPPDTNKPSVVQPLDKGTCGCVNCTCSAGVCPACPPKAPQPRNVAQPAPRGTSPTYSLQRVVPRGCASGNCSSQPVRRFRLFRR
jgi:hypothetical protein